MRYIVSVSNWLPRDVTCSIRTKNSRLLSEFREIDSYLTDSDSDSETSDQDARPSLAQKEFDNSLLRQGRALLAAAAQNLLPFPSSPSGSSHLDDSPPRPKVVFRLTRLDPLSQLPRDNDPRIALTVKMLEEMGIEVQLGPHPPPTSSPSSRPTRRPTTFKPTRQINLDLSILIALVSDLTHASLPQTDKEADERFIPSQAYMEWRKSKLRAKIYADLHKGGKVGATSSSNRKNVSKLVDQADGEGDGEGKDADGGGLEHSRALAEQLKQEMKKGLLNEMMDRVTDSFDPASASTECNDRQQGIEFWTTKEARDRCLRIVSKIGGPNEKRRAHALFASTSSSDDAASSYWKDSRYSKNFVPLHPIHIFPTSQPPDITLETAGRSHTREPFFRALEETCRFLLSTEIAPHPRALPASLISGSGPATSVPSTVGSASPVGDEDEIVGDEIQRASVMKANPKLTAHTVQSMLWGAVSDEGNGWTTITANRASVRAMIREMKGRSGVVSGGDWLGGGIGRPTDTNGQDAEGSGTGANMEVGRAAIWTVDPRSLAEGMRSDYVA